MTEDKLWTGVMIACGVGTVWSLWMTRRQPWGIDRVSTYALVVVIWSWLITTSAGIDWPGWADVAVFSAAGALAALFYIRSALWIRATRRDMAERAAALAPLFDWPTGPQPVDTGVTTWIGEVGTAEPPPGIDHVRDGDDGSLADRVAGQPCADGNGCGGGVWRWRHNGNTACWLDLDGIGPWTGWGEPGEGR